MFGPDWSKLKNVGIGFLVLLLVVGLFFVLSITGSSGNTATCVEAGFESANGDSACKTDEDYVVERIGVVTGNTANSPAPNIEVENNEMDSVRYLRNSIAEYIGTNSKHKSSDIIKVYSADSEQNEIGLKEEIENAKLLQGNNVETYVSNINKQIEVLNNVVKQAPESGGAAYLDAIIEAGKFASKRDSGMVLVFGSGLSDSGVLDFANNKDLLSADPSDVVTRLAKQKAIKDDQLEGLTVLWIGLGDVAAPQATLTGAEKENLRDIYMAVLEYMGADEIEIDESLAGESVDTDKKVKLTKAGGAVKLFPDDGVELSEDTLTFKVDSAEFVDKAAAIESVRKYIEQMKETSNTIAKIEGYVSDDCNGQIDTELAQKRADAVKRLFVEAGIKAERIKAAGAGKGPYEECTNGKLDEGVAKNNRIVKLLNGDNNE